MFSWIVAIFLLFCPDLAGSCLPTQQIEPTEPPLGPYPCSVCDPIYSDTCIAGITPANCLSSDTVNVIYTLETFPIYGDPDICSTKYTCPAGSTSYSIDPSGSMNPVATSGPVTFICHESGPEAGVWVLGDPAIMTVSQTVCAT